MEDFGSADRQREHGITNLIEELKARAPDETAMQDLSLSLLKALAAARNRNARAMNDLFERAYEQQNMLANKGVDVLVELEQVISSIKTLKAA
jgi:hypothetical protein